MRTGLILLCLLVASPALAWSPGPYTFDRCIDEFPVAVRGTIAKVDVVDTKPGGWTLSRATLDVERVYRGILPPPKDLAFYFWSSTDTVVTIAHTLAAKDRILVFLDTDLSPVKGLKTDPTVKLMLQFAKANHRGYLFTVATDKTGATIVRDATFVNDPKLVLPLADAEAKLAAKRKP